MPLYQHRPIVILAEQYQAGAVIEGVHVFSADETTVQCWWEDDHGHRYPAREGIDAFIQTKKGTLHVVPGDWVVTEANGNRCVFKPDEFSRMYELMPEEPQ